MKLIRFGEPGKEKPGVLLNDGSRIDVSGVFPDYDEAFFEKGGLAALRSWLESNARGAPHVAASLRLGPPIRRPSKIVCIGLNFRDHAAETKAEPPKEPVIFFKATTSLVGPNDSLVIPRNAKKVDWEVELAVVIGKRASYVPKDRALDYVAGYALHNDYSERSFQLERGGQWVKGKSADTFAPLGPFLATPDQPRQPAHVAQSERRDSAEQFHVQHDFRCAHARLIRQRVYDVIARRRDQHRNAGGRGTGNESAKIFAARRRGRTRHRGPGRITAAGCE